MFYANKTKPNSEIIFCLGSAAAGSGAVVVDANDPRKVILKSLSLVVEGRDDVTMDWNIWRAFGGLIAHP